MPRSLSMANSTRHFTSARVNRKVDELPFDFVRRRLSVIVEEERQQHELICKGAVEEVLEVCSYAKVQGGIVPLSRELRDSIAQLRDEMNEEGLRVLAVAYKDISMRQANYQYRSKDEAELVLAGFIAFLDPPKESIAEALAALRAKGVEVKILTGDSELVARRICKWVNLEVEDALLGSESQSMSDTKLQNAAARTTLFAKLTPSGRAGATELLGIHTNMPGAPVRFSLKSRIRSHAAHNNPEE